jgi:hypothetical protein
MKTKIKKITTITFSFLMVLAVFLTATHAKDIISAQPVKTKARAVETQATRTVDDPIQKSVSDLHNHSDKTMLKNFAKSMGDTPTLASKRTEKDDPITDDQPLSVRLLEAYFMMQLAYAYSRT